MSNLRTVRQFADEMGVHSNTVYGWIEEGVLPCYKRRGIIRIGDKHTKTFFKRCEFDARAANDDEPNDQPSNAKPNGEHEEPNKAVKKKRKTKPRDMYQRGLEA